MSSSSPSSSVSVMARLKPDTVSVVQHAHWPGKHGLRSEFWIDALYRIVCTHGIPFPSSPARTELEAFARHTDIVVFNSGENPVFWLRGTPWVFKFYLQAAAFVLEYSILHAIRESCAHEPRLCALTCAGSLRPLPDSLDAGLDADESEESPALNSDETSIPETHLRDGSGCNRDDLPHEPPGPFIPGTSMRSLAPLLSNSEVSSLAVELAETLRSLHSIPIAQVPFLEVNQHIFFSWLTDQRQHVRRRLQHNGHLAAHLIEQIDAYLPQDLSELVGDRARYVISHGDVNERHVFVDRGPHGTHLRGLIDFDSGGFHDRMFELIPIHISLFKCDKQHLCTFLNTYGKDAFASERHRFSFKMMCLTLLFKAYIWDELNRISPRFNQFPTLSALQEELWGLPKSFWE